MARHKITHWIIAIGLLSAFAAAGCASSSATESGETQRSSLSGASGDESGETSAASEEGASEAEPAEGDTESKEVASAESSLPVVATGAVAVIDGEDIEKEVFNEIIRRRTTNRENVSYRMAQIYKKRTLEQVIDDFLITRVIDESGVTISDEVVEETYDEFRNRFPNEEAFESFQKRSGASTQQIKSDMRKSELLKKYLEEHRGVSVTEEDAREYYDEHPEEFDRAERVKASHILIKTIGEGDDADAEQRARMVAEKAKGGADFAELASEYSEGPSADRGGDLGYFPKGRMVPEFDEAVFDMKKGEVSGPVKTRFGYHIIKLTGRKPAGKEPYSEVKDGIMVNLERARYKEALNELVADLRAEADIEEKPDNIEIRVEKSDSSSQPAPQRGIPPEVLEKIKKQMKEKEEQQQE